MGKKVTIQDIADALGVSRNTVSKAINNSDGLADATREKILQKAVELGYKQFSYARFLAEEQEKKTDSPAFRGEIALLTARFLDYSHFSATMLDKFQQELAQLGYTLNTHRVTAENLSRKTLPLTLRPERVSGIVCIEMFDYEYDDMITKLGIPVLFIDGPAKVGGRALEADQLYMDNFGEISQLMDKLLAKGYTKFGFIGDKLNCQSFFERYVAFFSALAAVNLTADPNFLIFKNLEADILARLEKLPELPEVFICANDFVAWDAIRALRKVGKRVPEDVLISGFDDSSESRISQPPITTVHIHTQIMAFSAAQLLISRIEQPSLNYRTVHTETELIWRESTGGIQ